MKVYKNLDEAIEHINNVVNHEQIGNIKSVFPDLLELLLELKSYRGNSAISK